jgi:hypothetical protein
LGYAIFHDSLGPVCICSLIGINSDVNAFDDQLVLGIKGTMSVAELKMLHQRMQQVTEAKARRGALARLLPPGYVRDGSGQMMWLYSSGHTETRNSRSRRGVFDEPPHNEKISR